MEPLLSLTQMRTSITNLWSPGNQYQWQRMTWWTSVLVRPQKGRLRPLISELCKYHKLEIWSILDRPSIIFQALSVSFMDSCLATMSFSCSCTKRSSDVGSQTPWQEIINGCYMSLKNIIYFLPGMMISIWMEVLKSYHRSRLTCQISTFHPHPKRLKRLGVAVKKDHPMEIFKKI